MFTYDQEVHHDPTLVLEQLLAFIDPSEVENAKDHFKGWPDDRKTLALRLMKAGLIPTPARYKFLIFKPERKHKFRSDEMKKREQTPEGTIAKANVNDAAFEKEYPTLIEYLTLLHFEDGSDRELSKVSIFVENSKFKAALNDNAERCSLYVAADSFKGALKALEQALTAPAPEWRSWNHSTKKK